MSKLRELKYRVEHGPKKLQAMSELHGILVNAAPEIADLLETYKAQGPGWLADVVCRLEALDKKLNGEG